MKAIDTVMRHVDDKTLLGQALAQVFGQLVLVFDHQNSHAPIVPGRSEACDDKFIIFRLSACQDASPKLLSMPSGITSAVADANKS